VSPLEIDVINNLPGGLPPGLADRIAAVARAVAAAEAAREPLEAAVTLVDDDAMQRLNRDYRGLDRVTDVLAFSQDEGEPLACAGGPGPLGDVVICLPQAERQAADAGRSLEGEVAALVAHGMLHLFGYDHETDRAERLMNARMAGALAVLAGRHQPLWCSFRDAWAGIRAAWRRERNVRIHVAALWLVFGLAWWLELPAGDWALVALAAGAVIAAELVNTAVEAAVDLTVRGADSRARLAKDAAAGAVLVAALASVVVAAVVFGPRLPALLRAVAGGSAPSPAVAGVLGIGTALLLTAGRARRDRP